MVRCAVVHHWNPSEVITPTTRKTELKQDNNNNKSTWGCKRKVMDQSDKELMEVTTETEEPSRVPSQPNISPSDTTSCNTSQSQASTSELSATNDRLSSTSEPESRGASSSSDQQASGTSRKQQTEGSKGNEPVCLLILGMAGSGKTSLLRRLDAHLNVRHRHYAINLDPAVDSVPYVSYIDIRDTVNYKEVCIWSNFYVDHPYKYWETGLMVWRLWEALNGGVRSFISTCSFAT